MGYDINVLRTEDERSQREVRVRMYKEIKKEDLPQEFPDQFIDENTIRYGDVIIDYFCGYKEHYLNIESAPSELNFRIIAKITPKRWNEEREYSTIRKGYKVQKENVWKWTTEVLKAIKHMFAFEGWDTPFYRLNFKDTITDSQFRVYVSVLSYEVAIEIYNIYGEGSKQTMQKLLEILRDYINSFNELEALEYFEEDDDC